jgi:2-methylcitrate dehydratase PrpD
MIENQTDKFVKDLYFFKDQNFPETVILQAKRCLLDYLGAAFAGAGMLDAKGKKLLQSLGGVQARDVSVIGFNRKAGIETAVFMNGISSHVAELDDGVRFGMIHPGAPIFSTLLPLAQKENIGAMDFLKGIIAGYEAAVRIACAVQPSHYRCGYHPTGTCGAIGATTGAAVMLGFSEAQMKDALSAASVTASGSLKVLEDGSELKPFNVGRAANAGLMAASMAKAGFRGPEDVFCGNSGFFSMMTQSFDKACLETQEMLGIQKVYVKPYASCRHTHAAIEAVLKIRSGHTIDPADIKSISVTTYQGVLGKHDHKKIQGISSAKMSIPFSTALSFLTGKAGIEMFDEAHVTHPEILALTEKVQVFSDEALSGLVPQKRAAIVEITTVKGKSYTERVDFPKGEPENPLSNNELEEKFISLATYGNKTQKEVHKIIEIVWQIETQLPELFQLL